MKRLLFWAVAIISITASAQEPRKGKLTVHQDSTIGSIIHKKIGKTENAKTAPSTDKTNPNPKKTAAHEGKDTTPVANKPDTPVDDSTSKKETTTATKTFTRPTGAGTYVNRQRYNSHGFRIQVYTGGNSRQDKVRAQQVQQKFKKAFPELSAYVHFYTPHWVCRVGDFKRREDAQRYIRKIRARNIATEVRIVRSNIFIAR